MQISTLSGFKKDGNCKDPMSKQIFCFHTKDYITETIILLESKWNNPNLSKVEAKKLLCNFIIYILTLKPNLVTTNCDIPQQIDILNSPSTQCVKRSVGTI